MKRIDQLTDIDLMEFRDEMSLDPWLDELHLFHDDAPSAEDVLLEKEMYEQRDRHQNEKTSRRKIKASR